MKRSKKVLSSSSEISISQRKVRLKKIYVLVVTNKLWSRNIRHNKFWKVPFLHKKVMESIWILAPPLGPLLTWRCRLYNKGRKCVYGHGHLHIGSMLIWRGGNCKGNSLILLLLSFSFHLTLMLMLVLLLDTDIYIYHIISYLIFSITNS